MVAVPLPRGSTASAVPGFDAARVINMMIEAGGGTGRNDIILRRLPGLLEVAEPSTNAGEACRLLYNFNDTLYAVVGQGLYKIAEDYTSTFIGTVDGSAPVIADDNATQMMLVADSYSYIFTEPSTLAIITDADFLKAGSCTFADGRFYCSEDGTTRLFVSDLFSGTAYNPLGRKQSQFLRGEILRAIVNAGSVWLLGAYGFETEYSGDPSANFPFDVQPATRTPNMGLAARHSVALGVNQLFFLGRNGVVYGTEGYSPVRISNRFIETQIRRMTVTSDAEGMFINAVDGHSFYVLTFPTGGKTFLYDLTENVWTEAETAGKATWRARCYAQSYGKHFVGDRYSGKIYELDMDTLTDGGSERRYQIITHPVFGDGANVRHGTVELQASIDAQARSSDTAITGTVGLSYSQNRGRTWSAERTKELTLATEANSEDSALSFDGLGEAPANGRQYRINLYGACDWALWNADITNMSARRSR